MRKKIIFIPILLLVALVLSGAACGKKETREGVAVPSGEQAGEKAESLTDILGKAKSVVSYKYDAIITTPGQPIITQKMWFKQNKIRMEMTVEGQDMVYLMDSDKQTAYMYIPAQNMAIEIGFGKAQGTVGESPTEQSASIMDYDPVTVGTEILDGKNCLVIEYTAETGKTKMWMWTKYGIPIQTEITTAQGTTVAEIKNIDFGSISDSMFELPAGVQPMQIPSFGL